MQMMFIILCGIAFFITFSLTYFYKQWAIKRSILDIPNERSSHLTPKPRGGGIAIIVTFYLFMFFLYLTGYIDKKLFLALIPGLGLSAISFVDDFRHISPSIRLAVQFICSGSALYFIGGFDGLFFENVRWLWFIIAVIGFVWFVNLYNFLDGSDGYASMETISVALILWYFTGLSILLILCFIVGGFLYWNWPKAKIFMGDVGSTTIGFILIVFGIYLHNNSELNIFFWLIVTSLFWFDATITLLRRILKREKLSQAHKNHMYQRVIIGGFSHLKTLLSGLGINILLFIICLAISSKIFTLMIGFILVVVIFLIIYFYIDRKFPFYTKR